MAAANKVILRIGITSPLADCLENGDPREATRFQGREGSIAPPLSQKGRMRYDGIDLGQGSPTLHCCKLVKIAFLPSFPFERMAAIVLSGGI
jgi:hypothetical protein